MKNLRVIVILLVMIILFVGCSTDKSMKKIDIIQFIQHPALDEARKGFIEKLKELGYEDGKNIKIDYKNASGDIANATAIATSFENDNEDLILAIATPVAQAVAQKIKDKPILVTAVTDPASAGLVKSNENVGTNISGTSDKAPVKKQLEIMHKAFPKVKKLGVIYSSAEDNSKYIVDEVKKEGKALGIDIVEATVQNSNDVQSVTEYLVGKVDALYVPTDNVISSSLATINAIAKEKKLPVVAAEIEQVKAGALFSVGISYKDLGEITAKMAYDILQGTKKVSDFPIQYQKKIKFEVNTDTAKALGVDVDKLRKVANE